MLHALAFHAGWSLDLKCEGDLEVDDHHTVEDTGLALGQAMAEALGEGKPLGHRPLRPRVRPAGRSPGPRGRRRVSGRPFFAGDLGLQRERVGALSCEMVPHFFHSFAAGRRA